MKTSSNSSASSTEQVSINGCILLIKIWKILENIRTCDISDRRILTTLEIKYRNKFPKVLKNVCSTMVNIALRNADHTTSFNRQTVEDDVRKLIQLAIKYKSLKVLASVCLITAKIAENVEKCSIIVVQNGHLVILRVLKENISNWKLCGRALSAISNLCSSVERINMFDSKTCELMYDLMQLHSNKYQVVAYAFNVLCNLTIHEKFRELFGKWHLHLLQNFIKAAEFHKTHGQVSKSATCFFANLTLQYNLLKKLQKVGLISLVINMMHIHATDIELQRHCCAVLARMSSTNKFVHTLVEDQGIELLFKALDLAVQNPWLDNVRNVKQALFAVGLDWDGVRMGSIHVAARNDLYESCLKCLSIGMNVNAVDEAGNTALHHSIGHQHPRMVQLLVSGGADIHLKNKAQESALVAIHKKTIEEEKRALWESAAEGKRLLDDAKQSMNELLFVESSKIVDNFPMDISVFIIEFLNPMVIMKYFGGEKCFKEAGLFNYCCFSFL